MNVKHTREDITALLDIIPYDNPASFLDLAERVNCPVSRYELAKSLKAWGFKISDEELNESPSHRSARSR